jgi:hypothetical protein
VGVVKGKHYYEVRVMDEGLCRVGWCVPATLCLLCPLSLCVPVSGGVVCCNGNLYFNDLFLFLSLSEFVCLCDYFLTICRATKAAKLDLGTDMHGFG